MDEKDSLSILIAGDVVPTEINEDFFIKGNLEKLVGVDIIKLFNQCDISTINLECALTEANTPIDKCGPNLKAHPDAIKAIKELSPTLVGLANNHIMDFGEEGLNDTLYVLHKYAFPYIGIGKNLNEVSQSIHIIEKKGWKIGFYACAEHEFTIATSSKSGANPFDPLTTGDVIKNLRKKHSLDKLIILHHGGKEYYQYPSPDLQRVCYHLVEKGADLVVCQHSHCIGAHEKYQSGDIVYGQGNFIFDTSHPLSTESVLVELVIEEEKQRLRFYPIKRREDATLYLAKDKEAQTILSGLEERSRFIKEDGFIEKNYSEFAKQMLSSYLLNLSPFGKWFSRIDRYIFKGRLIKNLYKKRKLLILRNMIECEAHREVILKGLDNIKISDQ